MAKLRHLFGSSVVVVAACLVPLAACADEGESVGDGMTKSDAARVVEKESASGEHPAASQGAILVVESDPPGARVEIGLKAVNGVITPGTGRELCCTPIRASVKPSDVSDSGGVCNGIPVMVTKAGYRDRFLGLSAGPGCSIRLGRADTLRVELNRLDSQ